MANHLANYVRSLVLPKQVEHWLLTYQAGKLLKIRANAFANGHCVTFFGCDGRLAPRSVLAYPRMAGSDGTITAGGLREGVAFSAVRWSGP